MILHILTALCHGLSSLWLVISERHVALLYRCDLPQAKLRLTEQSKALQYTLHESRIKYC
jgi:hypothetical protein